MYRKYIVFVLIFAVILTGCSNTDLVTELENEVAELKEEINNNDLVLEEHEDLIDEKNAEIERLNNIVVENEAIIADIQEQYENLTAENNKLEEEYNAEIEALELQISNESTISVEIDSNVDHRIEVTLKDEYIDNKEVITLSGTTENDEWNTIWEVEPSQFSSSSAYTISRDNIIYIVVEAGLHAIDIETGDIVWTVEDVGAMGQAPVIVNERIYCTGYDTPFLTCITFDGTIDWVSDPDGGYGAYQITVEDDYLIIDAETGIYKVDYDGKIIQ